MGRKSKNSKGSENGSVAPETEEKYPYYVFFILGNEFCERYAYYGMRSILVIYLVSYTNLQGPTDRQPELIQNFRTLSCLDGSNPRLRIFDHHSSFFFNFQGSTGCGPCIPGQWTIHSQTHSGP